MSIIEFPDPLPPQLQVKTITRVVQEDLGWVLYLSCGHDVFSPIEKRVGDPNHCGACLVDYVEAHK